MSLLEDTLIYKAALLQSEKYQQPGVGFTDHKLENRKTEEILLKQNNTIIALITLLHEQVRKIEERVEEIENFISTANKTHSQEVENLINKINNIEIGTIRRKSKQRSTTFGMRKED